MKVSFAAGLIATLAAMAFTAPTAAPDQPDRRHLHVEQAPVVHDLVRRSPPKLSRSIMTGYNRNEQRSILQHHASNSSAY